MSGHFQFPQSEIDEIRGLLQRRLTADRDEQKRLRARLRAIGFRISDFEKGLTPAGFDALVARGAVSVIGARALAQQGVATSAPTAPPAPPGAGRAPKGSRADSDEAYVLDLLDELLGERCVRQARFDWLLGDPGRAGQRVRLPVDGYWPALKLAVEYRERQHDEATPFFDKADRLTVSGVHRGEQRRLYDERREQQVPAHGLRLLVLRPSDLASDARGRLLRRRLEDRAALQRLLAEQGA